MPAPDAREAPNPDRIEHDGVSIVIPEGWDGRVLFLDPSGSAALLQLASFDLLDQRGFDPPPELPPGVEDPIKAMQGDDVLITLVQADHYVDFGEGVAIRASDFLEPGDPRIPRDQALARRVVCVPTHCFDLTVDFGSPPDDSRIEAVNAVLSTLTVNPAGEKKPFER